MNADDFFAGARPAPPFPFGGSGLGGPVLGGPVLGGVGRPVPGGAVPGGPAASRAGAHARPAPAKTWRPASALTWAGVGLALLALAVTAGWVLLAHSSGSQKDNVSVDRMLGRNTGLLLPAPVTADECAVALHRFPGITSPAGRGAFVSACVAAHGPSDPALTQN